MYYWRKLDVRKRSEVLAYRKLQRVPWHAPPHFAYDGEQIFIVTASCFEHQPIIGATDARMVECESSLIELCAKVGAKLSAWCVLPNHYHLLLETSSIEQLLKDVGRFHGSSAFRWNGEDNARGRKVWFRAVERSMRSARHYFASLNYIHHNPVKHGYAEKWQDWPFSSAAEYVERVGRDEAARVWSDYPVMDYGREWDPA
jgi:putative transposase